MTFPTPYTVNVLPYTAGSGDVHGNATDSWGDPVPQRVYGWAPAATTEPGEAGRDLEITDLDLLTPPSFTCQARDRVTIDTFTYEVVGGVRDYNHGPWAWLPGGQVLLRLVTG